jgi:hypothetical protein
MLTEDIEPAQVADKNVSREKPVKESCCRGKAC